MNAVPIALILLACVFGGALLGLWLQRVLPEHQLSPETKDVVRLATALIATVTAMVLGLLVSSAKSNFDRFDDELTRNSASVVMPDRALDEYGPETDAIRAMLKSGYARRMDALFSDEAAERDAVDGRSAVNRAEAIDSQLLALTPDSPVQQALQARAVSLDAEIDMTRALMHAQRQDSIPVALLLVLGSWLTIIFTTFGLFAPRNAVAVGALLACAVSASGAVFLILEMNSPFTGVITLSTAPMRDALQFLGQ
jgi:hypothetical protein